MFNRIDKHLIFSNRKRIFFEIFYYLYFFVFTYIFISRKFGEFIEFPNVLILIIPYLLLTLIRPTIGLSIFLIYYLTGLKGLAPSYGSFISLSILAEGCLVASLLFKIVLTKRLPSFKDRQSIFLFIFVGIYFISAYLNGNLFRKEGGGILKSLILITLIYILIIYFLNSKDELLLFFRSFTILGLIWFSATVVHITKYGLEPLFLRTPIKRGYLEVILDVNNLAVAVMMILPLIYYQAISNKRDGWKLLALICFPLTIFTVILTFSRNGFISLVIFFLLIYFKGKVSIKIWGLILIISLIIMITPNIYWHRVSTITSLRVESGLKMKLSRFQKGIGIISHHPLFGAGNGQVFTIHNTILQIGAELGLPALLLFLSLIYFSLRNLKKIETFLKENNNDDLFKLPWLLVIGIVSYIVGGLSISIPLFLPFFIILSIITALKHIIFEKELER